MNLRGSDRLDYYIQYGCGLSCPEGWLNFDASPRLRIEKLSVIGQVMRWRGSALFPQKVRYGDIVKGLPIECGMAIGIYSSHVLEHLHRESVVKALANTFHLLKPGGAFRLVVPDLTWRAQQFLQAHERGETTAADDFMRVSYLGSYAPASGTIVRIRRTYGNAAHRWMYDYALMARLLNEAGFVAVRRCKFGDAEDPMFALVEEKGRFYDSGNEELAIEAKRPHT